MHYSAKEAYQHESFAHNYERVRFSGLMGKYRNNLEQKAVGKLVEMLPSDISIADCPCGNGRWWPVLATRARRIVAVDVSEGMRRYASERARQSSIDIVVLGGSAEDLPVEDESVDYVFSHALTKHLPVPVQYQVLAEYSRVSKMGVICSFGVFTHLSYEFWRRRQLTESYPIFFEELKWMADWAGLEIRKMIRCTTPIGVENVVLFEKI